MAIVASANYCSAVSDRPRQLRLTDDNSRFEEGFPRSRRKSAAYFGLASSVLLVEYHDTLPPDEGSHEITANLRPTITFSAVTTNNP